ncbi:FkbM family methyltransferase [Promicromonospora sp. CA-289599]|uniref:FkbM family methyltransferase n=1 Tax=Promicromonospora sp. CA-289599 TaxID=3240014 RepID=UPI003D8CE558
MPPALLRPYTQPAPFHSQWGEDAWLAATFEIPETGVFVDVGAGDGVRGSNSLYFERLGWNGLCVDADPRNWAPLKQRKCQVETCAVSARPGPATFGMYKHKSSWSGLERSGVDYTPITVNCRLLGNLLQQSDIGEIDLLSIDVEGTEVDVWQSFDANLYRPAVVIIEFDDRHPDRHRQTLQDVLGADTYTPIFETPANLIFARADRMWRRRNVEP